MTSTRIFVVLLALALAAGALQAAPDDGPDAAGVLAKIDGALLFPDTQTALGGYTCRASVTTSSKTAPGGKTVPDFSEAEFLANISVDVGEGTRTWKDAKGKPVPAGAWSPGCGPWTVTNVMQVETELFLSPLAPRFPEAGWRRKTEKTATGRRLVLTPKSSSVNAVASDFLTPAVTRLELIVDGKGVPTRGVLGLQLGTMKDDAELRFEFEEVKGKKRISKIKTTLSSANLTIHPELRFRFEKEKGFLLPSVLEFEVPAGDLSPTMGRMMGGIRMLSALRFDRYEVEKAKKKKEKC